MQVTQHASPCLCSLARLAVCCTTALTIKSSFSLTFLCHSLQIWLHPWVKAGPLWSPPAHSAYQLRMDEATGLLAADESILTDLEGHSYPRGMVMKLLAANECNYVTASYFLLAEGKAETTRKLLPQKPWPFASVVIPGRGSSRASSQQRQPQQQQPSSSPQQAGQQKQVVEHQQQQQQSSVAPPAAGGQQAQVPQHVHQQQDPRLGYEPAQPVRPPAAATGFHAAQGSTTPVTVA